MDFRCAFAVSTVARNSPCRSAFRSRKSSFAVEPTLNADGTVDNSTLLDPTAVTDTFSAPGVSVGGVESTEAVEEVEVQPDPIHLRRRHQHPLLD